MGSQNNNNDLITGASHSPIPLANLSLHSMLKEWSYLSLPMPGGHLISDAYYLLEKTKQCVDDEFEEELMIKQHDDDDAVFLLTDSLT